MITKVEEFRDKHTVSGNNKGDILITGFANVENKKCFCIMADGHRYHEYGISTGSLLLSASVAPPLMMESSSS